MKQYRTVLTILALITFTWADDTDKAACDCSKTEDYTGNTEPNHGRDINGHQKYAQMPNMFMPLMYTMAPLPVNQGQIMNPFQPIKGEKGEPGSGCGACPENEDSEIYNVKEGDAATPERTLNIAVTAQTLKGDLGGGSYGTLRGPKGEKGDRGLMGISGLRGFRGPPGPPGPPGPSSPNYRDPVGRRIEELRQARVEHIQQDEVADSTTEEPDASRVAFSVAMTKSIGPTEDTQVLKFEEVVTNIGNGYNTDNGEFVAPVPGVYYFTYHILGQHSKPMEVSLKHNLKIINSVHSRQTGGYTGVSNSAVLKLEKGDVITLMLSPGIYYVYGESGHHTTFTGYLLYPE